MNWVTKGRIKSFDVDCLEYMHEEVMLPSVVWSLNIGSIKKLIECNGNEEYMWSKIYGSSEKLLSTKEV